MERREPDVVFVSHELGSPGTVVQRLYASTAPPPTRPPSVRPERAQSTAPKRLAEASLRSFGLGSVAANRRSLLSELPPMFAIQATRFPATASWATPAPVLLESASHVPRPLTRMTRALARFHAYTRLQAGPPD
jgi:hypothetical protein